MVDLYAISSTPCFHDKDVAYTSSNIPPDVLELMDLSATGIEVLPRAVAAQQRPRDDAREVTAEIRR